MFTLYNGLAALLAAALGLVSLGVLLVRGPAGSRVSRAVRRAVGHVATPRVLRAVDWRTIGLVVGFGYAIVVGFDLVTGKYDCAGTGSTSDPIAMLRSGEALWSGGDPFLVHDCGTTTQVPYGFAAVFVNALGSLGGLAGVSAAWGLLSVGLLPLAWFAAPPNDRRYVVLFLALLPIYFPLVAGQIDGASNSIVPAAVLATLVLSGRRSRLGEIVGGFLATARFPAIFPVVASRGSDRRWLLGGFTALATFALVTAATYARWGSDFYRIVFEGEVSRRSFSLNLYGVFLDHHALPVSDAIVGVQAALILAVTFVAFFFVRSPPRAAAIALVGFALLTPFLSFSILLALVPVALVGQRERWWLWAVALTGAMNYDLALNLVAWQGGGYLGADVLDVVLTAALLGLLVELVRHRREPLAGASAADAAPAPNAPPA